MIKLNSKQGKQMNKKVNSEEIKKENWKRTGRTVQENSVNGGGVITLEEERNLRDPKKTRLVAVAYKTIIKEPKED